MRALASLGLLLAVASAAHADSTVPERKPAPATSQGTFCEFDVFRADTHAPMGGLQYRVTLPGGVVRRGRVPANGIIHIDVPHEGECSIDLDLPPGMHIADEASPTHDGH